jgi:hypothetical protein
LEWGISDKLLLVRRVKIELVAWKGEGNQATRRRVQTRVEVMVLDVLVLQMTVNSVESSSCLEMNPSWQKNSRSRISRRLFEVDIKTAPGRD